jgi:hypothetical protein
VVNDPDGTEYPTVYESVYGDDGSAEIAITVAAGCVINLATAGLPSAIIPLRCSSSDRRW